MTIRIMAGPAGRRAHAAAVPSLGIARRHARSLASRAGDRGADRRKTTRLEAAQPHARCRSPRPQGRPHGHRGTRAHRSRHDQANETFFQVVPPAQPGTATTPAPAAAAPGQRTAQADLPMTARGRGAGPSCRRPDAASASAAALPKQYTPLLGRPLLSWTLAALLAEPSIDGIVVALAPRRSPLARLAELRIRACAAAPAATRREHSVANGARRAGRRRAATRDWVLVHDAARPCLRRDDLDAAVRHAATRDPVGGLLAVPVSDTLKRADGARRVARDRGPRRALARADAADVPLRAAAARARGSASSANGR